MIYQQDQSYKFFQSKATISGNDQYVIDKARFEADLLRQLQMDEDNKATMDNRLATVVVLPPITYTDITHTQAEVDRLAECQGSNGQLDDVVYYVTKGSFPDRAHSLNYLEITKLKAMNDDMGFQLFTTQTDLMASKQENSDLGAQLFNLQTTLMMKGVI